MRKIAAFLFGLFLVCSAAYAAAGSLDPTFGQGGTVQTAFGVPVIPSSVLLQSGGGIIVVAGFDNTTIATEAFGVVRYLPNGTLDSSFGSHGATFTAFTNFINSPNAAALQADGKIVVAGVAQSADGTLSEFAIARFNANGGLDSSFGTGGKVTTNFVGVQQGGVSNPAKVVLVQNDGKILVSGTASKCAKCGTRTALARYNSNGSLDVTFGSGGTEMISVFGGAPNALAELSNGDFLTIAGSVIAQFSSSGVLRPVVTGGTIVAASVGGTNVFQPDGKYLLAQTATDNFDVIDPDIQLVRFNSTAGVDFAFNNPPFEFGAAAVTVQPNGKIVVCGTSAGALGVARLNSDGSLDSTFGSGGIVATPFAGAQVSGSAVVLQADGKIVTVGQAIVNGTGAANLVLARYLGQ